MFNSPYLMAASVRQGRRLALALCLAGGMLAATYASAETKMVKAAPSVATQYSFMVLQYSLPQGAGKQPVIYTTFPQSINNSGVISTTVFELNYILVPPDYYAPVTYGANNPEALSVAGLSNGPMPMVAGTINPGSNSRGFIRTNGSYSVIGYPNPGITGAYFSTIFSSVNEFGVAVGSYTDSSNISHAMLYDNRDGHLETLAITYPNLIGASARGINDHGLVVGTLLYGTNPQDPSRFPFFGKGTSFSVVSFANTVYSSGTFAALNNKGIAVGNVNGQSGSHGVIYDTNTNTYQILDAPLATNGTQISGINDSGAIVGTYSTSVGQYGFVAYP